MSSISRCSVSGEGDDTNDSHVLGCASLLQLQPRAIAKLNSSVLYIVHPERLQSDPAGLGAQVDSRGWKGLGHGSPPEDAAGHARSLLNADDPLSLAETVVKRGLNVRQTEMMVRLQKSGGQPSLSISRNMDKDPDTLALEHELSTLLGLKVTLASKGKGGAMTIAYRTLDQLDGLLQRLR